MKQKLHTFFFQAQKLLLNLSYFLFNILNKKKAKKEYIIGVDEIASLIKNLNLALENSFSVNFTKNRFYNHNYDYSIYSFKNKYLDYIFRGILGPILLGYLLSISQKFIYIWSTGFLLSHLDGREYEFSFIRSKNKKIITFFIGNDIRAPKKIIKYCKENNLEMTASYYEINFPERLTENYDYQKKLIAKSADKYSNLIFNSPIDQASYIESTQHFPPYFYPNNKYFPNLEKFNNPKSIKIIHAPSDPVIKGTQLIRSAIKRLINEGYKFEYIEIIDENNDMVIKNLKEAHIVVNELYGQTPGLFGVEAMSCHCALITAADQNIETALPKGSNEAWYVTKSYQVYDHIKNLLNNMDLTKQYAKKGYEWSEMFASEKSSVKKLKELFQTLI